MKIGQLAKITGFGIETIRFYEKEGILAPVNRTSSGYREYDNQTVIRLEFIRRAKELGFSLKETKALLELSASKDSKCKTVKKKTEEKIKEINLKIADLVRIKESLESLSNTCIEGEEPTDKCPILENFVKKESP